MAPTAEDTPPRRHARTPVSILVQYRFSHFEDFVTEYSVNLSPGGIFLSSNEPRPLGEVVYLQFTLSDGSRLIEGLGKVVWVVPPEDKTRTPGMGIEFVHFDDESQALIRELCAGK